MECGVGSPRRGVRVSGKGSVGRWVVVCVSGPEVR